MARVKNARLSLVVAILGSTMAFVDGTVVNVALPVMQKALAASAAEMQWVVEAYMLFLASLVLVGGALGDRLGRRRVFDIGVLVFVFASVGCGAAPNAIALVIARAVQGIGAALLVPGSLALISAAYGEKERGKAIGTWSASSAITTTIGPVLGGWIIAHASWRWVFFLNVPLGAAALLLARGIEETRDEDATGKIDVLGATLTIASLGATVYALIEAPSYAIALYVVGGASAIAFVLVERKVHHPIVPLGLFRSATFAGTNLLTLFLYAGLGGGLYFVPFALIQVHGYSPQEAGAVLLPFAVLLSLLSRWAGGLVDRYGPRPLLIFGPLVAAVGFVLLAFTNGRYWTSVFPAIVVLGTGMGVTVAPLTTAVMGAVDSRHAGVASGINNAVARAAGLLAVAALGMVVAARFSSTLDLAGLPEDARAIIEPQRSKLAGIDLSSIGAPEVRAEAQRLIANSYVSGFHAAMLLCAGLAALGGLLGGAFVRSGGEARSPQT